MNNSVNSQLQSKFLFSIIIPIYNVEKYLNQCIESVLKQNYDDYEIVLINDGSTDSCGEISDGYAEKFSHISVIHKINGGLSDARNIGIENAAGKYLVFLDSDDFWWEKDVLNTLETSAKFDTDIIMHGHTEHKQNHTKIAKAKPYHTDIGDFADDLANLVAKNIFETTGWNKIIKRELVIKNNIQFPINLLHEDCAWCFDIAKYASSYSILKQPFYCYRIGRDGAITQTVRKKHIEDLITILDSKAKLLQCNRAYGLKLYLEIIFWGINLKSFKLSTNDKKSMSSKITSMNKNLYPIFSYPKSSRRHFVIRILGVKQTTRLFLIYLKIKKIFNKKK